MSAEQIEFTIFTAEGTTFSAGGKTLLDAVKRSRPLTQDYTIIAVVESASVVTPAPGKLTALIVRSAANAFPV